MEQVRSSSGKATCASISHVEAFCSAEIYNGLQPGAAFTLCAGATCVEETDAPTCCHEPGMCGGDGGDNKT